MHARWRNGANRRTSTKKLNSSVREVSDTGLVMMLLDAAMMSHAVDGVACLARLGKSGQVWATTSRHQRGRALWDCVEVRLSQGEGSWPRTCRMYIKYCHTTPGLGEQPARGRRARTLS